MPAKRQQQQLQEQIDNQEQWDAFIAQEGVGVIDVYSGWCGPCKAVLGLFRRIKNELGDDLLRFATAKSDSIDALEAYRNRSEPTFLMFSSGNMVGVVHGVQGPLLERTMKEKLEQEHLVIDGKAERNTIVDEALEHFEVLEDEKEEEEEPAEEKIDPIKKQVTVVVIKPDAVSAGKVDSIIEKLESEGYEVLAKEERVLTKEEAGEFYKQHEGSENFEELIEFMSSGPCMTLVLTKGETGEGVVQQVRSLIGPTDVEEAKTEHPESIRAQFGTDKKMNAIHASDGSEMAARELAFFFPKFDVPWYPEPPIQRTLALIRPQALAEHRDEIFAKIEEAGFEVAMSKELVMSKEDAELFYQEHKDKEYFDSLCSHMASGPVLALCLARKDAVSKWRELLGPAEVDKAKEEAPDTLRAQFSPDDVAINALHGSACENEATKELGFFFPKEQTVAVIKPNAMEKKDDIINKIEESGFSISFSKEQQLSREMAAQLYSQHEGKEFFDELVEFMTNGPSLFMVLSREEAVVGWRALMGPIDPEVARQENPECLRAQFGESTLMNAVHGSSSSDEAKQVIEQMFGDITIDPEDTENKGEDNDTNNQTES